MNKSTSDDFLSEFVSEVLAECGATNTESEAYQKLHAGLMKRVEARMVLEIISMLTPEDAEKARKEMDSGAELESITTALRNMPDSTVGMAAALARIREELIKDLGVLHKTSS